VLYRAGYDERNVASVSLLYQVPLLRRSSLTSLVICATKQIQSPHLASVRVSTQKPQCEMKLPYRVGFGLLRPVSYSMARRVSLSLAVLVLALVFLAAPASACCECKCRKVNPSLITSRSWGGCTGGQPIPFNGVPSYFVERVNCDGTCGSGRVLGYFNPGASVWSDAWVDEAALGDAFPCDYPDNRCTVWSPTQCSLGAEVENATAKSKYARDVNSYLPQVRAGAAAGDGCPAGWVAKTCKYTDRPCTLRCLLQETNVCDDDHHFCNYLNHGELFCVQLDCGNGFFGGSAPGVQAMATILTGDTEDA
jgi:hypothetical protein